MHTLILFPKPYLYCFKTTQVGRDEGVFDGSFGNPPGEIYQGGSAEGFFYKTPADISVMATHQNGKPTIYLDCKTLDLMVVDVDIFTSLSWHPNPMGPPKGGMSFGDTLFSGNDILWANTIAFMDKLQAPPILLNDKGRLSVGKDYLGYQWYKNDEAISGANGPEFMIDPDDVNRYYVKVEVNGGCKVRSIQPGM